MRPLGNTTRTEQRGVGRRVRVRIDRDVVEVSGRRLGRDVRELHPIVEPDDPYTVLERVLARSPLLRPGRACELGLIIESPRTIYRTPDGEGEERADVSTIEPVLPDLTRDVLDRIVARRRVHGVAWCSSGPPRRVYELLREHVHRGPLGRGVVVDRSSAAVTVLLLEGIDIRWARGAPGDDPVETAELLLRRAARTPVALAGMSWWHLEDVARPGDDRVRARIASEVEAACHALIGNLPRIGSMP